MALPYSKTPIKRIVDGGYLSWAHGSVGFRSWHPVRKNYAMRSGSLICLDSQESARKLFYPDYKSHRKEKREKRSHIHEKVLLFQGYLREDPSLRTWEVPGLEADDLVAILVSLYDLPLTAIDKDLLQIPDVRMSRLDGETLSISHFATRQPQRLLQCIQNPEDILLVLTLMGDKSDDIPRLIPPRGLDLFMQIHGSPDPWEMSYSLFGEDLLRNLYLAVLPSPWCFNPVPSPKTVLKYVSKGVWTDGSLRLSKVITSTLLGWEEANVLPARKTISCDNT